MVQHLLARLICWKISFVCFVRVIFMQADGDLHLILIEIRCERSSKEILMWAKSPMGYLSRITGCTGGKYGVIKIYLEFLKIISDPLQKNEKKPFKKCLAKRKIYTFW